MDGAVAASAAQREDSGQPWERIERIMTPVALVAVAVFLVWGLALADRIVANVYESSDAAGPLVFAQYFDHRGAGEIIVGNSPWYEPLYALRLTRWLPHHLQVWKAGPFLVYGVTVLIAAWTVARTVSRRAGLLVALAMAAPVPTVVLFVVGPANSHGQTLFHAVLLAAFLVTLPGLDRWRSAARWLWAAALAVTLAPGASSDLILLIGGVLPFLVAAGYAGWSGLVRRGSAALAAGACLIGAAAGRVLARLIEDHGIHTSGADFPLAPSREGFANVRRLLEDMASFAHGQLGGQPHLVNGAMEVIALAAMVAIPVLVFRGRHRALALVSGSAWSAQQRLLTVYWATAGAAIVIGFIGSTAPDDGLGSTRYMLILWPALLTLGAIVYGRRALAVIAMIAAASAILGCIQLARGDYTDPIARAPQGHQIDEIERFVATQHADHGFAAYWDAMSLTLQSDFKVRAYPVEPCPTGGGLCPFSASHEDSWYRPVPGVRSFYLVNPVGGVPRVPPPPARWGPPAASATFGLLRVYVYGYDLASLLRSGTAPGLRRR